jgi:hypothetical protein
MSCQICQTFAIYTRFLFAGQSIVESRALRAYMGSVSQISYACTQQKPRDRRLKRRLDTENVATSWKQVIFQRARNRCQYVEKTACIWLVMRIFSLQKHEMHVIKRNQTLRHASSWRFSKIIYIPCKICLQLREAIPQRHHVVGAISWNRYFQMTFSICHMCT